MKGLKRAKNRSEQHPNVVCGAADGTVRIHVRCMLWREHLQSTGVGGLQAAPHYWLKLRQPRVVAWVCLLLVCPACKTPAESLTCKSSASSLQRQTNYSGRMIPMSRIGQT